MNQRKDKFSFLNSYNNSRSEDENSLNEEESNIENVYSTRGNNRLRQRQENSLGELTKNFINYIREQNSREIDINEVVNKLKVKKRRIYDITNVLEGINY